MTDASAWLARTPEPVLEPELPICDAHHHLWDYPGSRYLAGELLSDIAAGQRVTKTVFMECRWGYRGDGPPGLRPVGETETIERYAREAAGEGAVALAAGIVGFADLTLGESVRDVLEAHLRASDRFRGIRHASAWDASGEIRNAHTAPPEGLLARSDFRAGFRVLQALGLSFDAWLYHPQIGELAALARAFPAVPIVLDHVGGPLGIGRFAGSRAEVFREWRAAITDLARCPNVHVKLGGLAMPLCGFAWHKREAPPGSRELADATAPYYRTVIDAFGPDRCMFESNFPVDKVSCSYAVLWNSFKRASADLTAAERRAVFHDTAVRVYRLA